MPHFFIIHGHRYELFVNDNIDGGDVDYSGIDYFLNHFVKWERNAPANIRFVPNNNGRIHSHTYTQTVNNHPYQTAKLTIKNNPDGENRNDKILTSYLSLHNGVILERSYEVELELR
jgi:hypothetical protein